MRARVSVIAARRVAPGRAKALVQRTLMLAALIGGLATAAPALAFECPAPQPLARPGVLKETPDQIKVLSAALAAGDDKAKISDIVSGLRAEHPGVEPAEIMNYMITAYCPVVAQKQGLSDPQRQTQVDQFVLNLRAILY